MPPPVVPPDASLTADPPIPLRLITKNDSVPSDEEPGLPVAIHILPERRASSGGFQFVLLIISLSISVFLLSLDMTIISIAIPKITDQFHSLKDVGWYSSAYLLSMSCTQLLYGKIYTFLPMKWVYVTVLSLFQLGSLLSAIAPNSRALIIGRAVAGLGSAGVMAGAFNIIATTVPLQKRSVYSGMIGGAYGLANVVAPLLGGVLTDKVGWRWCFYLNLPFGGATLVVVTLLQIPDRRRPRRTFATWNEYFALLDPWGTLFFVPALVSMLLALQWGGTTYAWNSARIIALLCVFGLLFGVFVGVQIWKQEDATIPPRIFRKRSIWSSALHGFAMTSLMFVVTVYLPIWFQAIRGVSAERTGVDNIPLVLSLVFSSLLAGSLISLVGYFAPFMIASSVIASIGVGLLATLKVAAQTVLGLKDVPIGTALMSSGRLLASGAISVAISQSVLTNKLQSGLESIPGVDPASILGAGATSLQSVPADLMDRVLVVYNEAIVSTFYLGLALGILSLAASFMVEWQSVKKDGGGG
ncbi:major facilitator superfamily domain-containing protein [Roridomyces roridus]|uniref:Major facilitator superfamily domain-containing protein n=1 Tax=Roridomyces roridus TaxID=1738132 RepID=A0AAD7B7V6_9AGAR|nr:major facilitator superfamily domain-containing protein [Roridomyces roridus]